MGLFAIRDGVTLLSEINADILTGSTNPSAGAGIAATQGSVFFHEDGTTWKKTGAGDTDWSRYSEIEGGGLIWSQITADPAPAESGNGYVLNATAAFDVTLPASPAIGDVVGFATLGNAETNNVTILLNGNNFNGATDSIVVDLNYSYFELLYTGDATTGWVLSNTDESSSIDDLQTFVGNDDNADPAVTEFTEENVVTAGDDLETSIDNLDIEVGDVWSFTGMDGDEDAPDYNQAIIDAGETGTVSYVLNTDDLETGISKLDLELQDVASLATAGVSWRAAIQAVTADDPTSKTTGAFSDDDGGDWDQTQWVNGDRVLSTNASVLGEIFEWDGSTWGAASVDSLGPNSAVSVRYDFLDTPSSQEDGAAYMMNAAEDEVIKIADFDLETAASIAISAGYTVASGDVTSADTVEGAIQKIDGNNDAQDSVLGTSQGDTDLGNAGDNFLADNTDVVTAIDELDDAAGDLAAFVGFDTATDNDLPDYTNAGGGFTPTNIVDGEDLELSIAKLDEAIENLESSSAVEGTVTGITTGTTGNVVDTYTATGTLGAKYFVYIYDGSGNRIAGEVYTLNNTTTVDFTEYAILRVGSTSAGIRIDADVSGGNVRLLVDNSTGVTISVKFRRALIEE